MIMILCGTYGMMTKIFCSICGARLRIMGEPVLSETEDSYMVDVRHDCLSIPIRGKVCEKCNGTGFLPLPADYENSATSSSFDGRYKQMCPECGGTGRVIDE
jgi:DnaJ-class molecular chaperone